MNSAGAASSAASEVVSTSDRIQENHYSTPVDIDHERTCWGCGLRVLVPPHSPVFRCGWCGAITNKKEVKAKNKNLRWRRFRDQCFVSIVFVFMLFFICGGIWAVYPVVFSIGYLCGIFHSTVAFILSISTLSTFCFAAFRPASFPPTILWGSYLTVGKGVLDNYTFCNYCSKPKSPRTHHCSSCGSCVLDLDHHCPFIGNCIGAANHRSFILFLISAVTSTFYISIMSCLSALQIWPPLMRQPISFFYASVNAELLLRISKEYIIAALSSAVYLPAGGLILVYLFVSSISVGIGLTILLWQQLCYIYSGKTYFSHLSAVDSDKTSDKDCQNLSIFFGIPFSIAATNLPCFWKSGRVIRSKAL